MGGQRNPHAPVFWILWGGILSMILVFQFQVAGGIPEGEDEGAPPTWLLVSCFAGPLVSMVFRWVVLPRHKESGKALAFMILGASLAEQGQIFQVFLLGDEFPETKRAVFLLSLVAVVQYVPFHARGLVGPEKS